MAPQTIDPILLIALSIWVSLWKGLALWRAAKLGQKNWFIAMLLINLVGIVELLYLFKFAKKTLTLEEMKAWKNSFFSKSK